MATVAQVENQIERIEGFRVALLPAPSDPAARKLNGNKKGVPSYHWSRGAPGSWSVQEWIEKRFSQRYPGLGVRVFGVNGEPVNYRQVKLRALRGSGS